MSAPGLAARLSCVSLKDMERRLPPQRPEPPPTLGEADPLGALDANEVEVEVRRMLPSELFQPDRAEGPRVKGDSTGVLAPLVPMRRGGRYSKPMDGLADVEGDCGCGGFDGSTPGRRWSTEARSFISYVSAMPGSTTDDLRA